MNTIRYDNPDMPSQAESLLTDVVNGKIKYFIIAAVTSDDEVITVNSGASEDEQQQLIGSLQSSLIMSIVDKKIHQGKK